MLHLGRVAVTTRRQKALDRIALTIDHHMNLQAVEIPSLAAGIAAKSISCFFNGIDAAPLNANVIADGHGGAVEDEGGFFGAALPERAQPQEEGFKDVSEPMEALVELPTTEALLEVALFGQEDHGRFEVAAIEAGCCQGNSDDFSVGESTLRMFAMSLALEEVVGQAIDCGYGGIHVGRSGSGSFGSLPDQLPAWTSPFQLKTP